MNVAERQTTGGADWVAPAGPATLCCFALPGRSCGCVAHEGQQISASLARTLAWRRRTWQEIQHCRRNGPRIRVEFSGRDLPQEDVMRGEMKRSKCGRRLTSQSAVACLFRCPQRGRESKWRPTGIVLRRSSLPVGCALSPRCTLHRALYDWNADAQAREGAHRRAQPRRVDEVRGDWRAVRR